MLFKAGLELFELNEVDVKYAFILRLKELLLKSISQTNTNKKEKAHKRTNKRKKIKTNPILRLTKT